MRPFAASYAALALDTFIAGITLETLDTFIARISLEPLNAWRPGGTFFTFNTLAACWTGRATLTLNPGYTGRPSWALFSR